MEIWNKIKQPPKHALKTIRGGRLKGMTDVNPQWRYQAMTENYGPCGVGWKYEIVRLWLEPADTQVCAFALINLYTRNIRDGEVTTDWNDPIPGIGGSMFVAKETNGLHVSDEAYKMAVTDALSVAMKMLGMASDIYAGLWDGSKYVDAPPSTGKKPDAPKTNKELSEAQWNFMKKIAINKDLTESELIDMVKWLAIRENIPPRHWKIAKFMLPEDNFETVLAEYSTYVMEKN